MKHLHATNTLSCTKPAQISVPLAFLALLLIGSVPRTALGQGIVINQPDVYVVVEPVVAEGRIIIDEPEPSWVIVQTAPPPVRVEVRPRRPYVRAIWVSGYWWWSGARYAWIGGHYVRPIRGYHFVAPRWVFSGGYRYHVRGYYRPRDATVRHQPYHQYRQAGYYGHRYDHSGHHRPTTYQGHHRGHGNQHRGHGNQHRGHGNQHRGHGNQHGGHGNQHRGHGDQHRGHGDQHRDQSIHHRGSTSDRARHGSPGAHRTAPSRGTVNHRGGTTPQRTSPSRRTTSDRRSAPSSHTAPGHRDRGSDSTQTTSRDGSARRSTGTARTRH